MNKLGNFNLETKEFACHTCDGRYANGDTTYRRCVNPNHLVLGSPAQNSEMMTINNRQAYGENSPAAKLTEEQAKEIIELYNSGKTNIEIGLELHLSRQIVYRVTSGQTWTHLIRPWVNLTV